MRNRRVPVPFYFIGFRCQKVQLINRDSRLHKMFPCIGLRHMDFLKYSGKAVSADETDLYSPSGLITGFSGHPCPEISDS